MTSLVRTGTAAAVSAWLVVVSGAVALPLQRLSVGLTVVLLLAIAALSLRQPGRLNPTLWAGLAPALLAAGVVVLLPLAWSGFDEPAWRLAAAMALLGAVIVLLVSLRPQPMTAATGVSEGFALLSGAAALATYLLLLTGALVTSGGAGLACSGWPLCNGELFPAGDRLAGIGALHRVAAAAAGMLLAVLLWRIARSRPYNRAITTAGATLAALYVAQVLLGAGNVWLRLAEPVRVAHTAGAALAWGTLVLMTALAFRAARHHGQPAPAAERLSWRASAIAYVNLMKPRIIELLLVTTVPAMVMAERGMPSVWLVAATVIGGTLTAGGANAINCYIDRDIDQVMKRTRRRALPGNRVLPSRALAFGVAIGVVGFLELALLVNLLAAVLSISALLFYVFIYTLWLKRRSTQNIVIGGAAGAIPPVVGWAAVTGRIDLPALVLFLIVVLWTPPHFWALAIKYREDYAAAGVPMLPVARGEAATRLQIFWYTLALAGSSLLLYVTGGAGPLYLAAALLLGVWITRMAVQLLRQGERYPVMRLFTFSITYLGLLFVAMILDQAAQAAL